MKKQVVVWPATVVGDSQKEDFIKWMKDTFEVDVEYLEEIETNPDYEDGVVVEGTGGRNDLFFTVSGNIGKFAVQRLAYGMRWIEDVYGNGGGYLYPERVREYMSWES